jgi:hypothetical protein
MNYNENYVTLVFNKDHSALDDVMKLNWVAASHSHAIHDRDAAIKAAQTLEHLLECRDQEIQSILAELTKVKQELAEAQKAQEAEEEDDYSPVIVGVEIQVLNSTFDAVVYAHPDEDAILDIFIEELTCDGVDVMCLLQTSLDVDIYKAAYKAVIEALTKEEE